MRWDLWYFKWPYITARKMATRLCSANCSIYLQQWQMTTFIVTLCLRYSSVLLPSVLFCQCYSCWKLISDSNGTTNSSEVKQGMIKSLSLNGVKIAKEKRNAKLWWTIKIIICSRKKLLNVPGKWPTWRTFLFNIVIPILYMFRATSCSSSGESIVSIHHLVYITLCRWPSGMQTDTYTEWYLPDVLIQLILLMLSTVLFETCREVK